MVFISAMVPGLLFCFLFYALLPLCARWIVFCFLLLFLLLLCSGLFAVLIAFVSFLLVVDLFPSLSLYVWIIKKNG